MSLQLNRNTFGNEANKGNTLAREDAMKLFTSWVLNTRLQLHMKQVAHLMKSWAGEKEHLNECSKSSNDSDSEYSTSSSGSSECSDDSGNCDEILDENCNCEICSNEVLDENYSEMNNNENCNCEMCSNEILDENENCNCEMCNNEILDENCNYEMDNNQIYDEIVYVYEYNNYDNYEYEYDNDYFSDEIFYMICI